MTDSARSLATNTSTANIPAQFLKLAKQINRAEAHPDYPGAGVTVTYSANAITGTFVIPIERTDEGDGERVQVVNFVK